MYSICLKGARDICNAVGENPKNINDLVRGHGLPAWKRGPKGTWRALPEDLQRWIREQRDRHISDYVFR
ncbi:MAG: DNA-binding protein [Pseudodesulfovibrio sp.]|nr:DNA-binding protein [Pseudodesulfovibrio sp.]